MTPTLASLRRYAIARSLPLPGTLQAAIDRLGFVQADPIRAPARAQDLILRHRVHGYRTGDLERRYAALAADEDFFVNYGFLARPAQALLHPRGALGAWPRPGRRAGEAVLAFVRDRGEVHPRDVDAHFAHGRVTNYWGGSSSATTHLLDHLHYRGLLRVSRRDGGIRCYAPRDPWPAPASPAEVRGRQDALVDLAVALYAPVPSATLTWLVRRLQIAAPQWRRAIGAVLARAKARLSSARVGGLTWYWPAGEVADGPPAEDRVRLLAPFDPIVWDRGRFEAFWDWAYRFEAYTPAAKRRLGYYALPILWREAVVGWANAAQAGGRLTVEVGYVAGRPPRDRGYRAALDAEIEALREGLGAGDRAEAANASPPAARSRSSSAALSGAGGGAVRSSVPPVAGCVSTSWLAWRK
ncbi:MAG: crosslink repair DNA glycosylase YcaQ family protein [Vicinamibacterales bacterium]